MDGIGFMGGMWLWWLIAIAVIAAIVWVTLKSPSQTGGDTGASAEELLKRRYARGEIDQATYEERLRDIRK